MNAILSKGVFEQIASLNLPPGKIGKPARGDSWPLCWRFAVGPVKSWKIPEPPQCVVHFPELVIAFGNRAFAARWT